MSKAFILVVEDDRVLRSVMAENLEMEAYDVINTGLAAKADQYMEQHAFDLVVLDLNLPDGDGIELCKKWRQRNQDVMILMLTARDREDDMLAGFAAGADDYIVKPYPLSVLLRRIEALIRRKQQKRSENEQQPLTLPGFTLDTGARQVFTEAEHKEIALTKIEYDLLLYLINNQNRAVSYDEILDKVWAGNVQVVQGAIRNTISSIRKKLETDEQKQSWRIVTLRGIGYRLETV